MKQYKSVDDTVFRNILSGLSAHPALQQLKATSQHKGSTSFAHSVAVAALAYRMAKKLRISVDTESLVRGAMLHDFYLYDTETMPYSDYRHAMVHPKLALSNAEKHFDLNGKERNIILSHMWPTLGAPMPRCREAWLVCVADTLCAWREMYGKGK